jgi:hypothetical protein
MHVPRPSWSLNPLHSFSCSNTRQKQNSSQLAILTPGQPFEGSRYQREKTDTLKDDALRVAKKTTIVAEDYSNIDFIWVSFANMLLRSFHLRPGAVPVLSHYKLCCSDSGALTEIEQLPLPNQMSTSDCSQSAAKRNLFHAYVADLYGIVSKLCTKGLVSRCVLFYMYHST